MSFDILLDSSLAKLERGGERNVSHDFTVKFHPPIELPNLLGNGNYKAALNRLITMSYSWNNIDSRYDNNKIRWKKLLCRELPKMKQGKKHQNGLEL